MAIDPISGLGSTGSQAADSLKTLSGDYQNFLKLLTVSLKNQDPTNPFDTKDLTNQIAMLSQVEQGINTNKNLETLINLYNSTQYNSVVSYIGKQIEASGNAGALDNGRADFVYYLANEAANITLTVKDEAGNVVYTGTGPAERGRNAYAWDGKNNEGEDLAEGVYTLEVVAKDAGGNDITSQVFTTGVVTAVDSAGGQVYLSIGSAANGLSIPLQSITSIRQPELEPEPENS